MEHLEEVRRVTAVLKMYIDRFDGILSPRPIHTGEVALKAEASALKQELRTEHRRMSANKFEPRSPIERAYLVVAIRQANGEFSKHPIVSPMSSSWGAGLRAVKGELSYHLGRLVAAYPEVVPPQNQ